MRVACPSQGAMLHSGSRPRTLGSCSFSTAFRNAAHGLRSGLKFSAAGTVARGTRCTGISWGVYLRPGGSGETGPRHGRAGGHIPTLAAVDSPGALQQDRAQLDAELLACCGARAKLWCGIKDEDADMPMHTTATYAVRGKPSWRLAVASCNVQGPKGGDVHVVLSIALHCPGLTPAITPGTSGSQITDLCLHWGTTMGHGSKWRAPPAGWHTSPPQSWDAGGGAWQTAFEVQNVGSTPEGGVASGPLFVVLMQLPLQGLLKDGGGVSFVLKTGSGKWLQDAKSNSDFYFPTSGKGGRWEGETSSGNGHKHSAASGSGLEGSSTSTSTISSGTLPVAPQRSAPEKPTAGGASEASKTEAKAKVLTQFERNRAELPDITKGVPWSPGEGPKGNGSSQGEIVPLASRDSVPWYTPSIFGDVDEAAVKAVVDAARLSPFDSRAEELLAGLAPAEELTAHSNGNGNGSASCGWMVDAIAAQEPQAERSLMHRYNTAQQLVEKAGASEDAHKALTAVLVWLRLSAARHLTWNRNYNVKPREISGAQDVLNTSLARLFESRAELRHVALACMAAAGRGGSSDVGQRIRDEILAVQSRNGCKGGMMEEWHQKLHNNTSPDDVVICQALIAMLEEGIDIRAYWRVLHASGITAQRLASYDRPIRNEPRFQQQQVAGLLMDLRAYLQTLQAVHSGADLGSAAGSVLGYAAKSMKGKLVTVEPVPNVSSDLLRDQLLAVLYQQQQLGQEAAKVGGAEVVAAAAVMLQLVLRARYTLRPFLRQGNAATGGRLRDVLFLDMSLDSTARTALETVMAQVKAEATAWLHQGSPSGPTGQGSPGVGAGGAAAGSVVAAGAGGGAGVEGGLAASPAPVGLVHALQLVALAVENAAVSSELLQQRGVTEDLCKALKWLNGLCKQAGVLERRDWAMQVVAVVDRLKRCLSDQGLDLVTWLQPTALSLGGRLNVPVATSSFMCEDAARGTALAPVSQLLAAVEPSARRLAGQGDWQIISRGNGASMQGVLRYEASLAMVQYETCTQPTCLLVDHVSGHEEVPEGVVVLLTSGDCPDVLSHSAVRARNMGVLMAACLSHEVFTGLKVLVDAQVAVSLAGAEVKVEKLG